MPGFNPERFRRIAKEGSWIVVGQIASMAGALVLVRVLTERLSPMEYGQLALGLTLAALVNQLVMGGIISGIGRFYSIAYQKQDLQGYFTDSWRLLAYGTLAVVPIGIVLMIGLVWLGYSQWMGLAAATLVFSLLSAYNSSLSGIQNAARQRVVVAFHNGLDAWLKILLALGVMLWLGRSSTAVVIGYVLSTFVVTVSQLFFMRRTIPYELAKKTIKHRPWLSQMWAYSWPFTAWGIFTWMQQVSDRWALERFATTEDVGQYAVLFQLGYTPIVLITWLVMNFFGPILYNKSGDAMDADRNSNVHQLVWKITYGNLIMTFLGFATTFLLHEWLFRILVAADYRQTSFLLPWILLAGGLFASGHVLSLKLMSEMKSVTMIPVKVITSLLAVMFNIIGAMLAGLTGVVFALILFSVIYFIWMAILSQRQHSINPSNQEVLIESN